MNNLCHIITFAIDKWRQAMVYVWSRSAGTLRRDPIGRRVITAKHTIRNVERVAKGGLELPNFLEEAGMSFAINKSHFREPGMSFRINHASDERTHLRSRNVVENR